MIRKFQFKDIDSVMNIWLEGNLKAHHFIPKEYWISNFDITKNLLPQANIFIYETDGQIQGFIGMQDNYLAGIFVDEKYRSQGIGKKLLDYIKNLYPSFYLKVYKQNEKALNFYLREGLTVTSQDLEPETHKTEYVMKWNNKIS